MSGFAERIRPHVRSELAAAQRAERRGELRLAFSHLERAHVLSQGSTVEHVRVHGRMLAWAARHRDLRELVGQLLRVVVAATKTFAGWVPHGNTGGANVGALLTMPIAADLAAIIKRARETS